MAVGEAGAEAELGPAAAEETETASAGAPSAAAPSFPLTPVALSHLSSGEHCCGGLRGWRREAQEGGPPVTARGAGGAEECEGRVRQRGAAVNGPRRRGAGAQPLAAGRL